MAGCPSRGVPVPEFASVRDVRDVRDVRVRQ